MSRYVDGLNRRPVHLRSNAVRAACGVALPWFATYVESAVTCRRCRRVCRGGRPGELEADAAPRALGRTWDRARVR